MSQLSFTISAYLITYKHKHKLKPPPPHLKGGGGEIEQLTQAQAPPLQEKERKKYIKRGEMGERETCRESLSQLTFAKSAYLHHTRGRIQQFYHL